MNFSFDIAKRYLFKKKRTNVINIVTGISIMGIAIGTAALVIILSVFNGFEDLLSGQFNAFNPDFKVTPATGKRFSIDDDQMEKIAKIPGIIAASRVLEEVALFEYKGTQENGIIKGVDSKFMEVIPIDSFILSGKQKFNSKTIEYGLVGLGMKVKLNININDRLNPITVYMFSQKKKLIGSSDFNFVDIYPSGTFTVKSDTDAQYVLATMDFVEKLIGTRGSYSAIELKLREDRSSDELKSELSKIIGDNLIVKNKFEQDSDFLKIMNIEKWVSYLIVSLTLLLVVFNLVVCLWMIVLEKKKDISIMKSFGVDDRLINRIFFNIGGLISFIGMGIGFFLAIFLYLLQSEFGLISVPDGFMISAYPIKLKFSDFIVVGLTVLILGFLASFLPARKAGNIEINFAS